MLVHFPAAAWKDIASGGVAMLWLGARRIHSCDLGKITAFIYPFESFKHSQCHICKNCGSLTVIEALAVIVIF